MTRTARDSRLAAPNGADAVSRNETPSPAPEHRMIDASGIAGAELVYSPLLAEYRFPAAHPFRPERFTLAVELMRMWGLLGGDGAREVAPRTASDEDLALIHSAEYITHVKSASEDPSLADMRFGLGPGDTPAFAGIHQAAALVAGATIEALGSVLEGRARCAFSIAGGLHHAHRDRASGFCVYNDPAIAIARAIRDIPGLRIAYIDIDAHHGDGVEEAFIRRSDVLTASVHESGRFLFPGTGTREREGVGAGAGFAVNVPLLPHAGDTEYLAALGDVVAPAVREFAPDVIVAQLGADSHAADPLAHLEVTTEGFLSAVSLIVGLADEVCGGRLAATGGGGYRALDETPVMWAGALAVMMGRAVPDEPPDEWRALADSSR